MESANTLNSPSSTQPTRNQDLAEAERLTVLTLAIAAGDIAALSRLYEVSVGRLFGIARAILGSKEDADEIVCDVYGYVWTNAATYNASRGSVMAWLSIITRNRSIDRLRLRLRRPTVSLDDAGHPGVANFLVGGTAGPDDILALFQVGTGVHRALQALSVQRRYLLGLSFFQGMSHEEISKITGIPIGTIKSHLRRSLSALKQHISADGVSLDGAKTPGRRPRG